MCMCVYIYTYREHPVSTYTYSLLLVELIYWRPHACRTLPPAALFTYLHSRRDHSRRDAPDAAHGGEDAQLGRAFYVAALNWEFPNIQICTPKTGSLIFGNFQKVVFHKHVRSGSGRHGIQPGMNRETCCTQRSFRHGMAVVLSLCVCVCF